METFDTNVIVRVLVEDDPVQSTLALQHWQHALEAGGVFVPTVVLIEVIWVLSRAYHFERPVIAEIVSVMLRTQGVSVEDAHQAHAALLAYMLGRADFSDYLLLESARAVAALPVHTFDRRISAHTDVALIQPTASP